MTLHVTYTTTRIVITDDRLFLPGGDVHEWTQGVKNELLAAARSYAPPGRSMSKHGHNLVATGRLLEAIRANVFQSTTETLGIDLYVDEQAAPYAKYVLGGTAAQGQRFIYSTEGWKDKAVIDSWYRKRQIKGVRALAGLGLIMGPLPPGPGGFHPFHLRVKGQRANPFISDAYTLVRRRHRSLPPMRGGALLPAIRFPRVGI